MARAGVSSFVGGCVFPEPFRGLTRAIVLGLRSERGRALLRFEQLTTSPSDMAGRGALAEGYQGKMTSWVSEPCPVLPVSARVAWTESPR